MFSLTDRLDALTTTWPSAIRAELRTYIARYFRETGSLRPGEADIHCLPYWFLLPVWLADKYNRDKRRLISKADLEDILWAQYCVFLSLRIKDDLYDGQGIASPLFFAADVFLDESGEIFLRLLGNMKWFWRRYHGSIRSSVKAFWEVDAMQRRRRVSFKEMRAGHACTASIFKIGAAAACARANRPAHFSRIDAAADELAVAGQMLDDFRDMNEDAEQGRLNYAARYIMGYDNQAGGEKQKTIELIAHRLLFSDRVARLFDDITRHVENARQALMPLKLPESTDYFDAYVQRLKATKNALDRERRKRLTGVSH